MPTASLSDASNMQGWDSIEPVLSEFANKLGKDILVKNPHGDPARVRTKRNTIKILFWSAPETTSWMSYNNVFDTPIGPDQRDGVSPTGKGTPILDGERTIAEIFDHTIIYVLFDLPHENGPYVQAIMRRIMEEYSMIEGPNGEEYMRQVMERRNALRRTQYVELCANRITKEKESAEDHIRELDKEIREYREYLVREIRRRADFSAKIADLETRSKRSRGEYEAEFDALLKNPLVHEIEAQADRGKLVIRTVELATVQLSDGSRRKLGKYRITIDLNSGVILVDNLTRKVDGLSHPHCFAEGETQLCFGNMEETIADFVSVYRFGPLIQMLLVFLQTPNEDDWMGRRITDWPKVEEEE